MKLTTEQRLEVERMEVPGDNSDGWDLNFTFSARENYAARLKWVRRNLALVQSKVRYDNSAVSLVCKGCSFFSVCVCSVWVLYLCCVCVWVSLCLREFDISVFVVY